MMMRKTASPNKAQVAISRVTHNVLATGFAYSFTMMLSISPSYAQSTPSAQSAPQPAKPAAPAVAAAPATQGIDKFKCGDIEKLQDQLKNDILRATQEVQSTIRQVHPALAYEMASSQSSVNSSGPKLASQANQIAKALVAAIKAPSNAANAASDSLNGSDASHAPGSRRASLKMYQECSPDDGTTNTSRTMVIENQKVAQSIGNCGESELLSSGLNATQVFSTVKKPDQVKDIFTRNLVMSNDTTSVSICKQPCSSPVLSLPSGFPDSNPQKPADYRLRTDQHFASGGKAFLADLTGVNTHMVNDSNLRVTQLPVCGTNVYLVSIMSLPSPVGSTSAERGFDNSTLLGVIAPVGDKTLILGSLSAQSFKRGGEAPMPISFLEHSRELVSDVFDKYNAVARAVGSTDRTVNGQLGGDSRIYDVPSLRATSISQRAAQ
jgi:hypothetical protein